MQLLLAHRCYHVTGWSPSLGFRRRHLVTQVRSSFHSKSHVITSGDEEHERHEIIQQDSTLISRIRDSYKSGETDGILELAKTISLEDYSPHDLIANAREATSKKGQSAGIINAWMGACYEMDTPALAWKLLQAYDDISVEAQIYPDVVSLSLVYSCLCRVPDYQDMAESVLERAMRMSKKMAGSKRRKALAASRRQGPGVLCKDVEHTLQELYGSEFRVLHETADLVVLSKPSGMVCFHKHTTNAGKVSRPKKGRQAKDDRDVSLEDALLNQNVPLSTLNTEARGLVHRIDRGTSGCIALAKTDDMHAKLLTQFFLRRAKKRYTAVVSPTREIESRGSIDVPVDGRPARSFYSILKRHGDDVISVEVETLTGRKHQVRVHCAKGLNSPILLDPIYTTNVEYPPAIANIVTDGRQRFFLHASSLSIPDYDIDVQSPLPCWWEEAISEIEKSLKNC
jgi:23S rRNA pseudouridine1911/1915/1917 synthase